MILSTNNIVNIQDHKASSVVLFRYIQNIRRHNAVGGDYLVADVFETLLSIHLFLRNEHAENIFTGFYRILLTFNSIMTKWYVELIDNYIYLINIKLNGLKINFKIGAQSKFSKMSATNSSYLLHCDVECFGYKV